MSGKNIPSRSSLSFCVPDGIIDIDHIMQLNPWKEAEKFNTSEMNDIQDVLSEFNSMVLERKHKDRRRKCEGKENVRAASNNASRKDEAKASKTASGESARKSTNRKKTGAQNKNADTTRTIDKPSKIPRPRHTIGERTRPTKIEQQEKRNKEKNGKSANKATKTSKNRTTSEGSSAKTGSKENMQVNKLKLAAGKRTEGGSNFQELPKRNNAQKPSEIWEKSTEKKKRRVQRREERTTLTVKQEQITMTEGGYSDMTFDGNALANSTMSSHVPASTMSPTSAAKNTSTYSCVRKSAKCSSLQIKQEKESPKVGEERKLSMEPAEELSEAKPRAKARRFDRSMRRDRIAYRRHLKRHENGAKRAIEEFSHHVVTIAKEMGYLKDIDFSDEDSCSCSCCSDSSYSTHSEYCSCGDCTSCSSDEFSEYTLCSCSGCSCCDSGSASDRSEDDK